MRTFNKASFEEQAKQFIKSWTRLLSRGKFQEAIDWLDRIENEDNEYVWTEKNLKEAFMDYGAVGRMPIINDPFLIGKKGDFFHFYEYEDGSGWAVDYDIPLDGERGDLTAEFSFKKLGDDKYAIFLHDLHVL